MTVKADVIIMNPLNAGPHKMRGKIAREWLRIVFKRLLKIKGINTRAEIDKNPQNRLFLYKIKRPASQVFYADVSHVIFLM